MVREINGPGIDPTKSDALRDALRANDVQKSKEGAELDVTGGVTVSGDLSDLISRVKQADIIRKDRVHEVSMKLQNGTLITPESLQGTAEMLVDGGV